MNLQEYFNKFKKKCMETFPKRIKENRTKIIDSFATYYGEKYRSLIEKRFDDIIFVFYVSDNDIIGYKNYIERTPIYFTQSALRIFGFDNINLTEYAEFDGVKTNEDGNLFIEPVKINCDDESLSMILKLFFGDQMLLSSDSKDNIFLSFEGKKVGDFLNEKQQEILELVYGTSELTEEVLKTLSWHISGLKQEIAELAYFERKAKDNQDLCLLGYYFEGLISNEEISYHDEYIGSSDKRFIKRLDESGHLQNVIEYGKPCFFTVTFEDGSYRRIVSFQLLTNNDNILIHEISHSETSAPSCTIKALYEDDFCEYEKNGLYASIEFADSEYDKIKIIEEILTEKSCDEVRQIFKSKGGNIFDSILAKGLFAEGQLLEPIDGYRKDFYLIDEFYEAFKEEIKEARITENLNVLVKKVGKENYNKFTEFVSGCCEVELSDGARLILAQEVSKIVADMKEYSKTQRDFTEEELNAFYEELRGNGHNIKRLINGRVIY